MQCPQCQHDNREGAKFCAECGNKFVLTCPNCKHEVRPQAKFCDECGTPLTASTPPQQLPQQPAMTQASDPASYTPQYLAEKIITSRSALEGERKQVTVMFADIKDSTQLIRDLDPEAAQQLLDPAIHIMMDAVHRFEGTVNQVLGDGIMAIFGAPIAHEDHATRACYAALSMQSAMQPYADEVRRTHGITMRIRVGLNSGEVVVRTIGNDLHMDYSAVGQTTNMASRMEQLAAPDSITLTAQTHRLVEGLVRVNDLGPVPVKGMTEPVEIYELTGASTIKRRLQAAVARGLTRFVGRDAEIEVLNQALEQAKAGNGQVVTAIGEAGLGLPGFASVSLRMALARCLGEQGAFAEGISRGEEGVRIAEAADDPDSLCRIDLGVSQLYLLKGDLSKAMPRLEPCLILCQGANMPLLSPEAASLLGYAYSLSGQVAEALPLLEQAVEQATAMNIMNRQSIQVSRLSEAYLLTGRTEETIDLALANEPGMRPLQVHCHRGLGKLYSQIGQVKQARAELSTAIEMYRDMEMTFWLPETEAALAKVEEQ